jgi:hypothetical protein
MKRIDDPFVNPPDGGSYGRDRSARKSEILDLYCGTIVPNTLKGQGLMMPMWRNPSALTRNEKREVLVKPLVLS